MDYANNFLYRYINLKKPVLIMMSGLSGTGKTYIAKRLANMFKFEYLRSDKVRKEIFNIKKDEKDYVKYGKELYSDENRKKVYDELIKRISNNLKQGKSIIVDCTFLNKKYSCYTSI